MTKKQLEEMDFLEKYFCTGDAPTQTAKEEYVEHTVLGKPYKNERLWTDKGNILEQAKRRLDITVKLWREDLTRGLLMADELKEGFGNHPYAIKMVDSILKGVTGEYRSKALSQKGTENTVLAFANFPSVLNKIKSGLK